MWCGKPNGYCVSSTVRWLPSFYLGSGCLRTWWRDYEQTNDNKNLLCGVIVCKFPADQPGLVTGARESQHCRLLATTAIKALPNGAAAGRLCQRAARTERTESKLPSEKVTQRSRVLDPAPGADLCERVWAKRRLAVTPFAGKLQQLNKLKMFLTQLVFNDGYWMISVFCRKRTHLRVKQRFHDTQPVSLVKHKPATQTNTRFYLQCSSNSTETWRLVDLQNMSLQMAI